jgi:hypothetical protein
MGARSTEPGHHYDVFRDQDGNLQVSSGAGIYMHPGSTFEVESGAYFRVKGGGLFYVNGTLAMTSAAAITVGSGVGMTFQAGSTLLVSSGVNFRQETVQILTTKGPTTPLNGYGVSVIRPNGTGGKYRLKRPVKGATKTIVIQSTLANKISTTTTGVNFGDTGLPQKFSFTATPSTQAVTKAGGFAVSLVGLSSSVWSVSGFGAIMGSSLNSGIVLVATAT